LLKDKVACVFGCWTSVSRKNVLPVFEEHNGLLLYPVQYEGNECSKNIIYSGAAPNQQILPAVEWLLSKEGGARTKFYLIATAYAQVYLWKLAVEKAGSFKVDDVLKAFHTAPGISFDAPEGKISVDIHNNHVKKAFRMGKIREDKQFDIIYETPPIDPEPY